MKLTNSIERVAQEQFQHRRAALKEALRRRRISEEDAERNARLWLAIACAAGCDLPELQVECLWPRGRMARMQPYDLAPEQEWQAELSRARDVAVRKALANPHDLHALQRSWDLQTLAVNLGCPEATVHAQPEQSREAA